MIKTLIKFAVYGLALLIVGSLAFSNEPEKNGIIRLIGFFAVVYWIAKGLFPERFKKND